MPKYKEPKIISTKAKWIIGGIGIVLVLIFIAVYLSVQVALRDEQVKKDSSKVLAAMQQYAGNHSGAYPASGAPDINVFVSQYNLPPGYDYSYGTGSATKGTMQISNKNCDGSKGVSVHYYLENSGVSCTGSSGI